MTISGHSHHRWYGYAFGAIGTEDNMDMFDVDSAFDEDSEHNEDWPDYDFEEDYFLTGGGTA